MNEVIITRKDIRAIDNYIKNGKLVGHMNEAGLSLGAMALVLNAIEQECNRILDEMNKGEENVC